MSMQRQSPKLPSDWMEAIDRIQGTIAAALEKIDRREAIFEKVSVGPTASRSQQGPAESKDLSNQWKRILDQARCSAGEADPELLKGEEAVRKWLEAKESLFAKSGKMG